MRSCAETIFSHRFILVLTPNYKNLVSDEDDPFFHETSGKGLGGKLASCSQSILPPSEAVSSMNGFKLSHAACTCRTFCWKPIEYEQP